MSSYLTRSLVMVPIVFVCCHNIDKAFSPSPPFYSKPLNDPFILGTVDAIMNRMDIDQNQKKKIQVFQGPMTAMVGDSHSQSSYLILSRHLLNSMSIPIPSKLSLPFIDDQEIMQMRYGEMKVGEAIERAPLLYPFGKERMGIISHELCHFLNNDWSRLALNLGVTTLFCSFVFIFKPSYSFLPIIANLAYSRYLHSTAELNADRNAAAYLGPSVGQEMLFGFEHQKKRDSLLSSHHPISYFFTTYLYEQLFHAPINTRISNMKSFLKEKNWNERNAKL